MGLRPATAAAIGMITAYMEEVRVLETQLVMMLMKRITMITNTVGETPDMIGVRELVSH